MINPINNTYWQPGPLKYPRGYREVTRVYTLRERIDLATRMNIEQLRTHLAWSSDSYTVETLSDIVQCVVTMSKPLAEILDDLRIPRETIVIEQFYLDGPPERNIHGIELRRVMPGKVCVDDVAIQPLMDPTPLTSLLASFTPVTLPVL